MLITKKIVKAIGYAAIYMLLFMLFRQQIIDLMGEANNKWFADCDMECTTIRSVFVKMAC